MSQTVTLRVPDAVAEWLRDSAQRTGRSVNEVGAALLEEARRMGEFAEIEFRSFSGERHACLKGSMQVWQIAEVASDYGMDVEATAAHFGWPAWRVQAALNYYEAFPQEIDRAIAGNRSFTEERLRRRFPRMRVVEVAMPGQRPAASGGGA